MVDKSVVFPPTSDTSSRIWFLLILLTNNYNGWLYSIHAPNFSLLGSIFILIVCISIYIAFYRTFTLTKNSLIFQKSMLKKTVIDWNNIHYLTGKADKNEYLTEVTIHFNSTNSPINIQNKVTKGFSQLVRLLRERVIDDRTPNALLADEVRQRKLQRLTTFLNGLLVLCFGYVVVAKFTLNDAHVPFLLETQYKNFDFIGFIVMIMIVLLPIAWLWYRKSPLFNEYSELFTAVIIIYVLLAKTVGLTIEHYNEYLIAQNTLPTTTLNTQVKGTPNWQRWSILATNNKTELLPFKLNDWQGANKNVIPKDFDNTYDNPPKYQLQAYQGKFGYYVITPEQFAQATPIK